MYYHNVRSIKAKSNCLKNVSGTGLFDALALTETWLHDGIHSGEIINLDNYEVFRADRRPEYKSTGGGCLLAIKLILQPTCITTPDYLHEYINIDTIGAKIRMGNSSAYLFCVYIPPDTSTAIFKKYICDLQLFLSNLNAVNVAIVGDFNVPYFRSFDPSRPTDKKAAALAELSGFLYLVQHNMISNLDLIFSSGNCTVSESSCSVVDMEECHPPLDIFFSFNNNNNHNTFRPNKNNSDLNKYNLKKSNFNNILSELEIVSWDTLISSKDVNEMVQILYDNIYDVLDRTAVKFVSKYTKIKKHNFPVWFSREVIGLINYKKNLLVKRAKLKNVTATNAHHRDKLIKKCAQLGRIIKGLLRRDYQKYIDQTENTIVSDQKIIYNFVNNIKKESRLPGAFSRNGIEINNPQEILNDFAAFFASTYEPLTPEDIAQIHILKNIDNNQLDLLGGVDNCSLDDLSRAFDYLPNKFSAGIDGIPCSLIKHCKNALILPLFHICNRAITSGVFPDKWKRAKVVPIHKSGKKNFIDNYRPISILSGLSKLLEICMYNKVFGLFKSVVCDEQHGFLPGRSTLTNLFTLNAFLTKELSMGGQVDVIHTDFSKAFDKISISILLDKIKSLGLSSWVIKLLASYLYNRKSCVAYNGYLSDFFSPTSGVPQESNLGPLLFLIFINDLPLKLHCQVLLYADDAKIFSSIKDTRDCELLQNNLNNWCTTNKLHLNVNKCKLISFTRSRNPIMFNYVINNTELGRVSSVKDLGITFDSYLTFNLHINLASSRALQALGFVSRICRSFKKPETLKKLYQAFVIPILDYGLPLVPFHTNKQIKSYESVQKRFLKLLNFKSTGIFPARGSSYLDLCITHSFDPIHQRRLYFLTLICIRLLRGLIYCPTILNEISLWAHHANSRSRELLYTPSRYNNISNCSPTYNLTTSLNYILEICPALDPFVVSTNFNIGALQRLLLAQRNMSR